MTSTEPAPLKFKQTRSFIKANQQVPQGLQLSATSSFIQPGFLRGQPLNSPLQRCGVSKSSVDFTQE
jgi:hypothetical protein